MHVIQLMTEIEDSLQKLNVKILNNSFLGTYALLQSKWYNCFSKCV